MSYEKIINVAARICSATQAGTISWKGTELDDVFQVSFTNFSARISLRPSRSGIGEEYILSILNEEGDLLEQLGDEDGRDSDESRYLFTILKDTHETARRQAMGVDQALDSILRELKDDFSF